MQTKVELFKRCYYTRGMRLGNGEVMRENIWAYASPIFHEVSYSQEEEKSGRRGDDIRKDGQKSFCQVMDS